MTDSNRHDIDDLLGELRGALHVEPSPEFEARVRERVRVETASTTRWWWMGAAAVAATVIVVIVAMPRSGGVPVPEAAHVATLQGAAMPFEVQTTSEHASRAPVQHLARVSHIGSLLDAPVIVPPGQERALVELAIAVSSGRLRLADSNDGLSDAIAELRVPDPVAPDEIQIESISTAGF